MSGIVAISIEVELDWGANDLKDDGCLSDNGLQDRVHVDWLLWTCDRLGILVSFGVVDNVLLERCTGTRGDPYRPGWFDEALATDSHFSSLDIVDSTVQRSVKHEFGPRSMND